MIQDPTHKDIYDRVGQAEKDILILQADVKRIKTDIIDSKELIKENHNIAREIQTEMNTGTRILMMLISFGGLGIAFLEFFSRHL